MKVFIDGRQADIDSSTNISLSLSIASHSKLDQRRVGYSKTIALPMTRRNREIMGDAHQVNIKEAFNSREHFARIEEAGCVVFEGIARLTGATDGGTGDGRYEINVIGPGKRWVDYAAATALRDLPVEFSEQCTATTIRDSWEWSKPVRFLPVQREGFEPARVDSNLFPPQKILTYADYHPFLHLRRLLEAIFANAGYSLESEFLSGELFDSLYMSGNYPRRDAELVKSRVDFRAGRFASAETTANWTGVVHASPYIGMNSIGNIVDTANPNEERGGVKVEGVYSVGDYFRTVGDHVAFVPPTEVVAAFEYNISYTTDYYMLTRHVLKGFDRVNLGEENDHRFVLANRNTDRRDNLRGDKSYRVVIFNHSQGDEYILRYLEVTEPDADIDNLQERDYMVCAFMPFASRTSLVTFETSNRIASPTLIVKRPGMFNHQIYDNDWAMYDGYVTERGTIDVDVTLRSNTERITPANPKVFNLIRFGGAENGMKFRINKRTTVRPVFDNQPPVGSTLRFADVAAHDNTSCLELINALRQMFNLQFFTDHLARRVIVEPRDTFYRNDVVVDLSRRLDLSKPYMVRETGEGSPKVFSLRYSGGDGAVSVWNMRNGGRFGSWSAQMETAHPGAGEQVYENALFSPSLNQAGAYPEAVDALLVQSGERNGYAAAGDTLNFHPKIVRYTGMERLPQGQTWGWPAGASSTYPFLAFHHRGTAGAASAYGQGFTLCFEDRDGKIGLHSYYDRTLAVSSRSKRVEVYVKLYPEEVEALVYPNRLRRDFRALYKLTIEGEEALFRLEEVSGYDPASGGSTKCVFVKEI